MRDDHETACQNACTTKSLHSSSDNKYERVGSNCTDEASKFKNGKGCHVRPLHIEKRVNSAIERLEC